MDFFLLLYMPTDRLARGPWGLADKRPTRRTPQQASITRMVRLLSYPCSPRPARQAISKRISQ